MKKLLAFLLLLMLCACTALAEAPDYAAMTDEELTAAMAAISAEMGRRAKAEKTADNGESLGKIKDIFPDEALAMCVRDKCGKFSIEQTVTQEDLDRVTYIDLSDADYGYFTDLTGIGQLRNLREFRLINDMRFLGTHFPEEFYTLTNLKHLEIGNVAPNFCKLSESLGNLTGLTFIDVGRTPLLELPESIGNLKELKYLDIGRTKITELPDSIWALDIETLNMAMLPIK